MHRLILAIAIGLVLACAIPAAFLVSRSSARLSSSPQAAQNSPVSPQERCVVAVMGMLGRSLQAVQEGDTSGLDVDEVAAQYGTESAVFHVFSATQAVLIGRVISRGADRQLTAIEPEVRRRCAEFS